MISVWIVAERAIIEALKECVLVSSKGVSSWDAFACRKNFLGEEKVNGHNFPTWALDMVDIPKGGAIAEYVLRAADTMELACQGRIYIFGYKASTADGCKPATSMLGLLTYQDSYVKTAL